ncbi:MAG: hypothetical protein ACYDDS_03520 [Candidatus Sulfotelmatobacter sp.]|jgi:hypothetical protein
MLRAMRSFSTNNWRRRCLIGMETTGNRQWFIELVEDLGHEIWIGDAAQIRASYVRKQKTDKRDVRIEESWSMLRPNRWCVERSSGQDLHRWMIQREISRVLVLNLSGKNTVPKTPTGYLCP